MSKFAEWTIRAGAGMYVLALLIHVVLTLTPVPASDRQVYALSFVRLGSAMVMLVSLCLGTIALLIGFVSFGIQKLKSAI